ncbi:HET-domain-containing protein, partial [Amniculicola lignicola CBS 123094]
MNPYQYSPLLPKPNSVRLLRLRAGDKAEIRVQIYDYFIDSSRPTHEYEALSYVWGDASQTKRIIVEDRLGGSELGYLDITLNLHTALCRLRNPGLDRFLWVDAVCINQSDIKERDRQVQLMVKIYASATRVIVWLGEMANESDWVIKMIRNAARAAQRKLGVRVWPTPSKENERDQNLEKWRDAHTSKMLLAFLSRPWFRRVWVLQEVAAAQSILILCGREELPGQAFSRGLDNLQVLHNLQNARLKNQIQAIIYLIDWIIDPAHYSNLGILPLGELVDMFQVHEATDRRDKVYALLAMSSQDLERTFRVDYNIVWSVLFDRLVKSIFGNAVEVMTWNNRERALIRTEGGVLGRITGVERGCGFSMQTLHIKTRELWTCQSSTHAEETTRRRMAWTIECSVQNSANVIQADDILVYLRGAKYPSIIRLSYDHFKIIAAVARPQLFRIPAMDWDGNWEDFSELMPTTAKDLTLLWDWEWSE